VVAIIVYFFRQFLAPVAIAASLRLRREENNPVKTAKGDRQMP